MHLLNWVEIPVRDIERAKRFYEKILLAQGDFYTPSEGWRDNLP